MLHAVAPFGHHGPKRQDSDRPPLISNPSNYTHPPPSAPPVQPFFTVPSTAPPPPPTGHITPAAIYAHIHDTSQKRIATLDYLRQVHSGQFYYFSTLAYPPATLSHLPSMQSAKLGRRATNYLLLGTSLSPLLDLHTNNPIDYLRALSALLAEFDTYQQILESGSSAGPRGKMGAMFNRGMRGVKGRRSSAAADSLLSDFSALHNASSTSLGLADAVSQEFVYLQTPSLPFEPDFGTSFSTLAEVLVEAYEGVLRMVEGPESVGLNPGLGEAFAKADKAVRKILVQGITKEFEEATRREIRGEVGGLGKVVLGGLM